MERIATSFCSFETLVKRYSYVDKTDMLWRMVSDTQDRMYFLSRPRRFGKSLMIDTLKCIFEGRRELFKGLKIEKHRYDWKKYPVVKLDMSELKGETIEELRDNLTGKVEGLINDFGLTSVRPFIAPGKYFGEFLTALAAKYGEYVVLIDEYDVPLQGFLGQPVQVKRVRSILHDFYIQLKAHSNDIRFMMMTGVTKLTKLSVFSGLNNPVDLTMDYPEYAGLLGYTPKEIETTYPKRLDALAKKYKTDRKGALKKLLHWYDSYRFCPDSKTKVCNPISIAKALTLLKLDSYWVRTAVSTLVMEQLGVAGKNPKDFEGCTATKLELDVCDALTLPAKALMYQSGYLTIKGLSDTEVDEIGNPKMILGSPNFEVRTAINAGWFDYYYKLPRSEFDSLIEIAKRQLADGDLKGLLYDTLYAVYAMIPPTWRIKCEADAKRHFQLFMRMLGARVNAEKPSLSGYADAIIETKDFVWIFEFKLNKSSKAAIRQIKVKGYADEFKGDKRPVTLIGINFKSSKRNIDEPEFSPDWRKEKTI